MAKRKTTKATAPSAKSRAKSPTKRHRVKAATLAPSKKRATAPRIKAPIRETKPKRARRVRAKRPPRPSERPVAPRGDRVDLLDAIDDMVSYVPGGTVSTRQAPVSQGRTPWMILSAFYFPEASYDDVLIVLRGWRDDATIERRIQPQRLSRIQIKYTTDRGQQGEYTLAEIGPWELAVSRAVERVGIRDDRDGALVERYGAGTTHESSIDALLVWFSSATVQTLHDRPDYSFGIGQSAIRGAAPEPVEEEITDEFVELPVEEPDPEPARPNYIEEEYRPFAPRKKPSLWRRVVGGRTSNQIGLDRARESDRADRAAKKKRGKK